MLKYTHGSMEPGPTGNKERLFVHRIHDSGHHVHGNETPYHNFDPNPQSTPTTFWKSPYAGDNSIFHNSLPNAKNICMRPEVNVSPSKLTPKFLSNEPKPANVKGILKNKLTHIEVDRGIAMEEITPRGGPEKLHLITTGTGKGRPHMATLRSTSAEKRVQFNGIPIGASQEGKSLEKYSGKSTTTKFPAGRRLYHSNTSTRILGTRKAVHLPTCGRFYGSVAVSSIGGGESHIKNQIHDFVKRLRLAESEKLAKAERARSAKVEKDTRNGPAERVRRPRCKTSMNRFHDWEEFDIDKSTCAKSDEVIDASHVKKEPKVIYNVYHSKDSDVGVNNDSVSSVDSVKTRSVSGEENTARTPSAVKIIRPKPMVSLYTKYSHITTNYLNLNKYGTTPKSTQNRSRSCKSTSTQKQATNFCDRNKTSQILGWLEEVKNAQTVGDTKVTSGTEQSVPNKKS